MVADGMRAELDSRPSALSAGPAKSAVLATPLRTVWKTIRASPAGSRSTLFVRLLSFNPGCAARFVFAVDEVFAFQPYAVPLGAIFELVTALNAALIVWFACTFENV